MGSPRIRDRTILHQTFYSEILTEIGEYVKLLLAQHLGATFQNNDPTLKIVGHSIIHRQ